ncbi:MAG: hypothetical protein SP1CHLAM54_08360 [Chlamydiia bacterium]|nr:hypothetical protein [Chlamydiia bacterium]MCH9615742.1 hypothetical protein [Chlamydiia bacterium]MCH9628855.1 hypothetical protein [Chlamydiia bacterium]
MENKLFEWVVVGAGPAGIAAVGRLIDHGVEPKKIAWVDPKFSVGDLGEKWLNVSSNTKIALFTQFLEASEAFGYQKGAFPIDTMDGEGTCLLKEIAQPLQTVTDRLKERVCTFVGKALSMRLENGGWTVGLEEGELFGLKVILATGADPKSLSHESSEVIPLETALNPEKLKGVIGKEDVIGVYGASHSSVLVLLNLLELKPKQVINFYRSPHRYAVHMDGWILFDNTGLKGKAADWARENIDGQRPDALVRYHVEDPEFDKALSTCTKMVYPIGFERRKLPVLEQFPGAKYNEATGVIAPNLYGFGIAYPQGKMDQVGNYEYRVGLGKFMGYLNEMLPIWLS